jgi:hypothetical protein
MSVSDYHTTPATELDPNAPRNVLELLAAHRATSHQLLEAHAEMVSILHRLKQPAQMETIVLGLTGQTDQQIAPVYESRERFENPTLSIGVFNPNPITVYFSGIGTASATTRSPSCPPNTMLVLPISASTIELACDVTDLTTLGENAVVFLLRFFTVQAAYLGTFKSV